MLGSLLRHRVINKVPNVGNFQLLKVNFSVKNDTAESKTFDNQSKLPKLPIPELDHTLKVYEQSLIPILSKEEFESAKKAISQFVSPGGLGSELQNRLKAYASKQKDNWLEEIWIKKAYLEYREPVLLNSNFWIQSIDHPEGIVTGQGITQFQLSRAAGLIYQILNLNDKINSEQLSPEYARTNPVCMNQYKFQFGTSRIPELLSDRLVSQFPCSATHITVSYKNQLMKLHVYDRNMQRLSKGALFNQLNYLVRLVDNLPDDQVQPPIGIFTAAHRDIWANIRQHLITLNPTNVQNLSCLDQALFVLCLDSYNLGADLTDSHYAFSIGQNGHNRWFDKSFQLIVLNNGRVGVNGEHSPSDAPVPGRIFDEAFANEACSSISSIASSSNADSNVSQISPPEILRWHVDNKVTKSMQETVLSVAKSCSNIKGTLLQFSDYGASTIKAAKASPDGFFQLILQLAYYRLHEQCVATYETASTRQFLHGRTETVRSCTKKSQQFVQNFNNPNISNDQKLNEFKLALDSHSKYMKLASSGLACDRHLLGLRCMLKSNSDAIPPIFSDPSYIKSVSFILSTSNMSPGTYFQGGFSPVVPHGYGINYALAPSSIKASVSTWNSCLDTDNDAMMKEITKALGNMANFLNFNPNTS